MLPAKRLEHFIRKVEDILIRKLKRVETILQNEGGYQDLHAKLNQIKIYLQEKNKGFTIILVIWNFISKNIFRPKEKGR